MIRSLRVATLAVLLIGGIGGGTSAAWAQSGHRLVRFHGLSLRVPAGWPVYDLQAHPSVCVRFDRHAVYLGTPGAQQRCPAHAVGRTEAILVSPAGHAAATASRTRGAGGAGDGPALPGADQNSAAHLALHGL